VYTAFWWAFFGLEYGDWLGWKNPAYAIGMGLIFAFIELRYARAIVAAWRRRFAKPT
jgi:hypothetical protein